MSDVPSAGSGTLFALFLLIVASVWLGTLAQRAVRKGSFLKGYFLGNRGLGAWALALTATVQSGGTFMGFPSLVYSFGWIVALWIAAYMVVPLTGFGVLGKRLAQLSRRTGAITVPELLRERFASPGVGVAALLFILLYMLFMMVAQFKAGALIMKVSWPGAGALALAEDVPAGSLDDEPVRGDQPQEDAAPAEDSARPVQVGAIASPVQSVPAKSAGALDRYYYLGLTIFALTVVGYTVIGGFLAAVWTDLFQSVLMFVGVVLLVCLAVPMAGGLEYASRTAAQVTGPGYVFGPGYAADDRQFLPLGLAFSFFFVWVYAGLGSPAGMVRIMACKSTATIRRSIFLLSVYNFFIYIPLIVVCICGRALIPDLSVSDEIIPRMALKTTESLPGGSLLAGLILAAPFGAVMATVSSYLVVIASALVRDLYHRFIHAAATDRELRLLSYTVMILVGAVAFAANIQPVEYLQAIVVFSGTGAAATFVVPALMAAYWRRATAAGALAAMLGGASTMIGLYVTGFVDGWRGFDPMIGQATKFRPYFLLDLDPIVWGLAASLVCGIVVSLLTSPPQESVVSRLFDAQPD